MIKVKRIDHVAIAVADRDASARDLSALFGLEPGAREVVSSQATDVAFLYAAGGSHSASGGSTGEEAAIELCAPSAGDGNPGLLKFLSRRGPGLHHICFEVDDLPEALATLKAAGVRLIDEAPRPGARGHQVAFLHPSATGGVLFELCAHGEPAAPHPRSPA
jgi:methylmalonyl-CoA/ethylmalonyl-CoA epimerase